MAILALQRSTLRAFLFLLILMFFPVGQAAQAESLPVHVAVGKMGTFDLESQIFTGEEDVRITYDDLQITGDELIWDLSSGDLWVLGSVHLKQGDLQMAGDALVYNLNSGEGTFSQAQAEFILPKETGSVFLQGQEIAVQEGQFNIEGAQVTTCDLPASHYHLATKEIEVILGEKAIIRGVTYYEGRIPIFYWPYLVIPLDTKEREEDFSLPVLGYGAEEGYYILNTFNYNLSPQAFGHIYLDAYSNFGLGAGVRHFYNLEKYGQGSLYAYHIPSVKSQLWKGSWDHEVQSENWGIKTSNIYEDSLRKRVINSSAMATLSLDKTTGEAWFGYKEGHSSSVTSHLEYGGRWGQRLTDNWGLSLRGQLTEQEKWGQSIRLLDYLGETNYKKGKHTLALAVEQKYNPDLLETESQPWRHIQRLPELKWSVSDLGLKIPLRMQSSWGRYQENPQGVEGYRLLGQLTLPSRTWRLAANSNLSYQGEFLGAAYGQGQKQASLYGRLSLAQGLSSRLGLTVAYSQREVWGESPFRFDAQTPLQEISLRAAYQGERGQANIASGYNFRTNTFGALTFSGSWRPQPQWALDIAGRYSLSNRSWETVVPMLEYKSEKVLIQLGGRYRFAAQLWERIDSKLSLPIGKTWHLSYDSIYEPSKGGFTSGLLTVTKDLHCREVSFSYGHVDQRIAFQYTIKAFPTLPLGWDSKTGVSLFDLEDVSDIIGVKE